MEVSTTPPPPGDKAVRVSRYQGSCAFCDFVGLVIEGHDPAVMSKLACFQCVLGGKASSFAPEHPAMRPIVFVARAMRGDEPFATLLKAAEKQRENPEAHRAAVERTQKNIANLKQRASDMEASGKTGRAARRAADAMARSRAKKRAKLPPGR
jgi:hypothetical protein